MIHFVARRFAQNSASTAILRYYKFLSFSIEHLEQELERYHQEREVLYDHLFENQTFRTRIRPLVDEFRHRQAQVRHGFHPYGRPTSSPAPTPSNNRPAIDDSHSQPSSSPTDDNVRAFIPSPIDPLSHEGIQGRASVRLHDQSDNDHSLSSYYTAIHNEPGSKKSPIIILDDEEEEGEGCEEGPENPDRSYHSLGRD